MRETGGQQIMTGRGPSCRTIHGLRRGDVARVQPCRQEDEDHGEHTDQARNRWDIEAKPAHQ